MNGETFTQYTAKCAGLGGCGRTFRITRESLDATVGIMTDADRADAAQATGIAADDRDALAAAWGYDFCLSCVTGEDHGAEYVLDGDA